MPIYEYACRSCKHTFEELVRAAADEERVKCPRCAARQVERKPSVFAAHAAGATATALPRAGCGRCGDPDGPCGPD